MGQAFLPEQLDLIDKAFEQAWAELSAKSRLDPDILKALLRDKLLALACSGVSDAELMRTMAVSAVADYEKDPLKYHDHRTFA